MPVSALQAVKARIVPLRDMAGVLTSLVGSDNNSARPDTNSLAAIKQEVEIAAGDPISLEAAPRLGKPSALTCPDCHGALFQLDAEPALQRYRCHTGHAFTAMSLLEALHESAENSIWASVRAMQEKAILLDHIANHTDQKNVTSFTSASYEAKAAADRLRAIAQQHERTRLSFSESCDDTFRKEHQLD
jgi:two-component system chemotaxis response regulator CheB